MGRGIEKGRDIVTDGVLHPIETIKDTARTAFDGYNAIGDAMFGVSTQGARERNAIRGGAVNNQIDRFTTGDSATRIEMISELATTVILGAAVAQGTRAVYREGPEINLRSDLGFSQQTIDRLVGVERVAPVGNRTAKYPDTANLNKLARELPHYHRKGPTLKNGQTAPGQSDKRHRPWENSRFDKKWTDRF